LFAFNIKYFEILTSKFSLQFVVVFVNFAALLCLFRIDTKGSSYRTVRRYGEYITQNIFFLRRRAGIYMPFQLVGWKRGPFSWEKSWKKGPFSLKKAGISYLTLLDTLLKSCNLLKYIV
jgi:hypothetical protein